MSSDVLDRGLVLDAVRVTEAAAIAAWAQVGRGDEKAADQAAVDAMRTALNEQDLDGEIVIGEGERDEAPMLYIGQGGAPEGVLACAALKCVGGQFQGRLVFRNADERSRAERWGITQLDKKYDLHEIVRADTIFAATGVTDGALLEGVKFKDGFVHTHTLVMNSASRTVREVRMKRPA